MKVKFLDQTHPDYDEGELDQLHALAAGGKAWHAIKDTWFPQYAREPDDVWAERKALAGYTNDAGPIVSMLSAMLFSEAATVEHEGDEFLGEFLGDVDRQGTPWEDFWSAGLNEAQIGRRFYCWVNMPSREGREVASRADEDAQGLRRAFLVPLSARQVRNWGTDAQGLAWIMVRGVEDVQVDPTAPRERRYLWTAITRTEIRQWAWAAPQNKPAPLPEDEAVEVLRVTHSAGRLPVVLLELPAGMWTMGKLADPALMSARAQNDLAWALHQAANELLVIKSKSQGEVVLGQGAYLAIGPDDDALFVGPSGVAFEHLERQVVACREAIYRVVHQMALGTDGSASNAARSGESKAMDWQALGVILAAYQDLVLRAMGQALDLVGALRGEPGEPPTVSGLEGWKTEDLGAWLEQVLLATEAPRMSQTYRREVGKVQARRLLADHVSAETLDAISDEIDASPMADPMAGLVPTPTPPPAKGEPQE